MTMLSPLADPAPLEAGLPETGLTVPRSAWNPRARALLVPELQEILERLHRELEAERATLLAARQARPARTSRDELPEAKCEWRVAPLPSDLTRRRVEVTAPACRPDLVIDMLRRSPGRRRADSVVLDFEDSMKPSWNNVLQGLVDLVGAVEGSLSPALCDDGDTAPDDRPLLAARVRGLHLDETNVRIDDRPISAGLFDLACAAYWTARTLLDQGRTPLYTVPKCESPLEARWWNRVLDRIESELDLPTRSIKATVAIETLPAAAQAEEILYEVRDHAAALSLGLRDRHSGNLGLPRRRPDPRSDDSVGSQLESGMWRDVATRLVSACHRHGALALGPTACLAPAPGEDRRAEQLVELRAQKDLERALGFDGGGVAHPELVDAALGAFPRDHQLDFLPEPPRSQEPLPAETGPGTLSALRRNARLGIAYLRGWNDDCGRIELDDRLEDLASFECARVQTAQWLGHATTLGGGETVTPDLVHRIFDEELARLEQRLEADGMDAHELEAWRKARLDAESLFTEAGPRAFLTTASDPAHLSVDQSRARLRGDSTL